MNTPEQFNNLKTKEVQNELVTEVVPPASNVLACESVKVLLAQYPDVFIPGWYEGVLEQDLNNTLTQTVLVKRDGKVIGCLSIVRGRENKNEFDWLATNISESAFSKIKIVRKLFDKAFSRLNNGDEFFWYVNADGANVSGADNPTGKDIDFGASLAPARNIYLDMEEKGLHSIKHELVPDKWGKGNHAYKFYGKIAR